jgi:homoserine dehydrogenase
MKQHGPIDIALLGAGTVGGAFLDIVDRECGGLLRIKKVMVRSPHKPRSFDTASHKVVYGLDDILGDRDIRVVVDLIDSADSSYAHVLRLLQGGKSVVTANRALIARKGRELLAVALQNRVHLFFEAAAGGSIPIVDTLIRENIPGRIEEMTAILSGASNYILCDMDEHGSSFEAALQRAKSRRLCAPDPKEDTDGRDAAQKLAILVGILENRFVDPDAVPHFGIDDIAEEDVALAAEQDLVFRPLARYAKEPTEGAAFLWVGPGLVSRQSLLGRVRDEDNAFLLRTSALGRQFYMGCGAGAEVAARTALRDVLKVLDYRWDPETGLFGAALGNQPLEFSPQGGRCRYLLKIYFDDERALRSELTERYPRLSLIQVKQNRLWALTPPEDETVSSETLEGLLRERRASYILRFPVFDEKSR